MFDYHVDGALFAWFGFGTGTTTQGEFKIMKAQYEDDALSISLEVTPGPGYEQDTRGFDLIRRAIVKMIEEFDTHLLEKEEGTGETYHFYASILAAVARHYMVDDPVEREITVQQALQGLTDYLVTTGMLQETIGNNPQD